jgi:nucleotide-binding universal stress UspA family protein
MCFKRIFVAIDFSPLSQSVFEQALTTAQQNKACLMLFHCLVPDTIVGATYFPGELGLSPRFYDQTYQQQQLQLERQNREIQKLLQGYCETATRQGVSTEFTHHVSEPGPGICQLSHSWDADLIVMGRRGRKGLTEAILGSVSNYVLHHASCSVLVVQTSSTGQTPLPEIESSVTAMPQPLSSDR